ADFCRFRDATNGLPLCGAGGIIADCHGPRGVFARRQKLPKMNKSAIVATAALGIVAAASAGFWVGANRSPADPAAATAPAGTAATAAAPAQSGANGTPTTVEATRVAVMAMPQS